MPNSPVIRSRTPPDLKWLLNERAAIAGEIATTTARHTAVGKKLSRVEHQQKQLQKTLDGASQALVSKQASLNALDTTIRLAYSQVEPSAAGVVKAWAGKYGQRGALRAFLLQQLRDAAPSPLTTTILISLATQHFGLPVVTAEDRRKFRCVLAKRLREYRDQGLIEGLHDPLKKFSGIWRWKQPPTLADLAAQAAAMREAPADGLLRTPEGRTDVGNQTGASLGNGPADTDTARREVAAQ